MGVHIGSEIHQQHMEGPRHEQVESLTLPKESVTLWGPHTGAGSWQDLLTMERGAMLKQVFWQDL